MRRRHSLFLFISTLFFSSTALALVNITCLKYVPAKVTLIGILEAKIYPGLPNFVSIEAGDAPETSFYIVLRPPICTASQQENWMLGHERISEVQLAVTKLQYDQLAPYLGGVLTVRGVLFEALNEHHHTPVLIEVSSFEGAEKREITAKPKPEKILKPSEKFAKLEKSVTSKKAGSTRTTKNQQKTKAKNTKKIHK